MRTPILLLLVAVNAAAQTSDPSAPPRFEPRIDDPMLTPLAPAPRQLQGWEEARALLLQQSSDLRIAEAAVDRAEGRWRQSLSALLPNARAAVTVGYPTVGVGSNVAEGPVPGLASVSATQSVFDLGAWRGLSSAKAGERSASATLRDARRRLDQGLARSLVAVVAAERAAELNRVGLRQALERAALAERTLQLGAGTQLDVVRVKQDLAVARSALIAGDEQVRRTREALGLLLGSAEELGVKPGFGLEGLVQQTQQSCRALAANEPRADVDAQRAQADAAAKSTEQAQAGYLPTVGLNGNAFGLTTDPGFARFGGWSISAVLSVPIWEGGLRGGLVTERRGAERQARETASSTERNVSVEIARARRGVTVAESLLKSAKDAAELAQQTDALTRRSFEIGRATSLELVQSAVALRQAELNLALREFEAVQARLDAFLTEASCD